jgi:hypothetical protein
VAFDFTARVAAYLKVKTEEEKLRNSMTPRGLRAEPVPRHRNFKEDKTEYSPLYVNILFNKDGFKDMVTKQYAAVENIGNESNVVYHHQLLQTTSSHMRYKAFLLSEPYFVYLNEGGKPICRSLFDATRSHCIKHYRLRKCANTLEVQFKEYFRAFKIINTRRHSHGLISTCSCTFYSILADKLKKSPESPYHFLQFLLCVPTTLPIIPLHRTSTNLHTLAEQKVSENGNLINRIFPFKRKSIRMEKGNQCF